MKKKLLTAIILFPWSAVIIPAAYKMAALADAVIHFFGTCLGIH